MGSVIKKQIKTRLRTLLNRLPYVRTLHRLNSNSKFPAGHFYSSVVSLDEIKIRQKEIWPDLIPKNIPGINLNEKEQLQLLYELSFCFKKLNFPERKVNERRYFFRNSYFSYGDGYILGAILLHFKPRRIIEVGSGFSSALMLDVNDLFLNNSVHLTFIEPFPENRLKHILKHGKNSNVTTITKTVQEVELKEFKELEKGDILFIDSSHIVKTGSDVNYILFQILPVLKKGVLIHFHDIYHPFEYPKSWILDGFGWNESYFLKAFLMYNNNFKILFFSEFIVKYHRDKLEQLPLFLKSPGSSLWLEKV
ncbi:MAG: class I SAM-dependent methyltransferase [Bacteroidota bacterium]